MRVDADKQEGRGTNMTELDDDGSWGLMMMLSAAKRGRTASFRATLWLHRQREDGAWSERQPTWI